jgi:hypothetical protein
LGLSDIHIVRRRDFGPKVQWIIRASADVDVEAVSLRVDDTDRFIKIVRDRMPFMARDAQQDEVEGRPVVIDFEVKGKGKGGKKGGKGYPKAPEIDLTGGGGPVPQGEVSAEGTKEGDKGAKGPKEESEEEMATQLALLLRAETDPADFDLGVSRKMGNCLFDAWALVLLRAVVGKGNHTHMGVRGRLVGLLKLPDMQKRFEPQWDHTPPFLTSVPCDPTEAQISFACLGA